MTNNNQAGWIAMAMVLVVGVAGCANPDRDNRGNNTNTIAGRPGGRLNNPTGEAETPTAPHVTDTAVTATGDAGTESANDLASYRLNSTTSASSTGQSGTQ